jgi:hypothetical protein
VLAGQVFYLINAMAYVGEERCELGGSDTGAGGVLSVLKGVHERKERGARSRSRKPSHARYEHLCVANFVGACGRRTRPQRVSGEAVRGSCAEASSDEHGMADGGRLKRQDARAQNMLGTRAGRRY